MADENVPETAAMDEASEGDALTIPTLAAPAGPSIEVPLPPLFGKYDSAAIVVADPGLVRYINLRTVGLPYQGARYANRQFGKIRVSIVERLITGMMRGMHFTGKKMKAYRLVEEAFDIVAEKTKDNPIQVLIHAIERAAPKEEITRLRYGGIKVPKAVDCSPQRRLDIALRNICTGAREATFKNRKSAGQCLADELMRAAKGDMQSFAVAKKEDLERVAKSAR